MTMSQAKALSEARRLQAIVQRFGVKCTIELKVGRPWAGDDWYSEKEVLMNHHTAGPSSGLTPSYAVCRNGRPGVPGPLCNGYGGRDLVFRIVTMGLANHPGAGGPLTVAGVTMPKDSARIASFGIEWEHNGVSDWPSPMMEFMGRVGAAVLEWMGRPLLASIEHKTWAPERKIDRNDFSQSGSTGQALIKKYQGNTPTPPEDDFMGFINNQAEFEAAMTKWAESTAGNQALMNSAAGAWRGPTITDAYGDLFIKAITERVKVRRTVNGELQEIPLLQEWADTNTIARQIQASVNALAALVADGSEVTEETIRQAVEAAFDSRVEGVEVDFVVTPPEGS
jgi:hypothetical protein